jgi:tetratricopeptide (TPR) repeat protein
MPPRSISLAVGLALLGLGPLGLGLTRSEAATNGPVLPSQIRLEEAIWRDEILGDVNGAIRGYRSLLEARNLPDRVKAETLYQLAFALALKGNPDKAVETLIQVVDDFPGFEPFAQYASQGIRLLSPDAVKRGRQWQHDETIRIGDLAIALDGALSRADATESLAILEELEESIELLTGQMPTGSERSGWESRTGTLGEVHRLLRDGKPGEARKVWDQAGLSKTLSRRDGLFETDDFSAWIIERRDAFARALQRGDVSAMTQEAEPLHRFAALLGDRIEESPARQYARFLGDALTGRRPAPNGDAPTGRSTAPMGPTGCRSPD